MLTKEGNSVRLIPQGHKVSTSLLNKNDTLLVLDSFYFVPLDSNASCGLTTNKTKKSLMNGK